MSIFHNGVDYEQFANEVTATLSISRITNTANMIFPSGEVPWVPYDNTETIITYQGQRLISGYASSWSAHNSSKQVYFVIEIRSLEVELSTASVTSDKSWINETVGDIITDVCRVYSIPVLINDPGSVISLTARYGDTIYDVINRACATGGCLCYSDNRGGLVVGVVRESQPISAYTQDQNSMQVTSIERYNNTIQQYSEYEFSQSQISGERQTGRAVNDDMQIPKSYNRFAATETTDLSRAARWERNRRRQFDEVTITASRPFTSEGNLLLPGDTIYVNDPTTRLDGNYIIGTHKFTYSTKMVKGVLTLARAGSFDSD